MGYGGLGDAVSVFGCWDPSRAPVFQTGWSVESLITQTLIIHVIRIKKTPFLQGGASWPLTITTISVIPVSNCNSSGNVWQKLIAPNETLLG